MSAPRKTFRVDRKTLEQIRRLCLAPYRKRISTYEEQADEMFKSVRLIENKVASILGVTKQLGR